MHLRKSKKIFFYFFLFILVGSTFNVRLSNFTFNSIKDIQILGLEQEEKKILLEKIKTLNLENIFLFEAEGIIKLINKNNSIESYNVSKIYPSKLKIKINKTDFLAKINQNDKILLVGSNGKLSENYFTNSDLPYIFGKPKINVFLKLKYIIEESKFSYQEIDSFYFFKSKRWDLKLRNNIILKLPNENLKDCLDSIFSILNDKNFNDIKIIDARVKNQIIING